MSDPKRILLPAYIAEHPNEFVKINEDGTGYTTSEGSGTVSIPATAYADNATALAALGAGKLYKSTTSVEGSPIILITVP